MKKFTRILTLALLFIAGALNVNALESYDFQELCMALGKGGPWAVNDGGDAGFTINDATMHYLGDYTDQGFAWNQRFAYEYVDGRGKFTMRNKNNKKDNNCGMFSWDYDHYFSILGLKNGDKVTITIGTGTVTFVSETAEGVAADAAVTTDQAYTITTTDETTRLDIKMAKASLIKKIVIEVAGEETVPIISLSKKTLALVPGATAKLAATVDPSTMDTQWKSDNEAVATVAADGTVTAVAAGTANIINYWESAVSDTTAEASCAVTVADVDLSKLTVAKTYDFTAMGDVTLTIQEEAAGKIWNAANGKENPVYFCTNEGLENIAVQAVLASNKGWSIVDGKGLYEGSGAGRCAAVGSISKDQIVEFIYTGSDFYTNPAKDDGIDKVALNEGVGRAIYQASADGMIGFELEKGNYVEKIVVYEAAAQETVELPKFLTFPNYNDAEISAYNKEWTATVDGDVWTLYGFNNNKNAWNYVRCGQKNNDQTATITSPAFDAVVSNVVITVDKTSNVTKATLSVLNGETTVTTIDITESFKAGAVNVPVEGAAGYSYKLTVESSKGANGTTQISKIGLYGEGQYQEVHIANTQETAYTVAKAIELIDAGDALAETVYVKGIISQIDSYNSTYKSITYWISDNGTTEKQMQCYSGKGLNGADFSAVDDIVLGAEVIVKGTLTKYGDIYEFSQSNEQVSYTSPTVGIDNVTMESTANAPVYNLQGQKVAAPTKGLYIVNGRKVVIK